MFYSISQLAPHNLSNIIQDDFYIFYSDTLSSYPKDFKWLHFMIMSFYWIELLPLLLDQID